MIASISDSAPRGRRRAPRAPSPDQLAAAEVLHNLNGAETAASFIVKDASENKVASLATLGSQSIAARKLVEALQARAPSVKLNREDAVNVLQFLGDVYSNQLEVVSIS